MRIYLIRHGDPDYENDTLTTRGHKEAKALAHYMKQESIDHLYASPMGRAQATAKHTAHLMGLDIATEEWTAELSVRCTEPASFVGWNVHGQDVHTEEYLTAPQSYEALKTLPVDRVREIEETIRKDSDAFLKRLGYEREGGTYRVVNGTKDKVAVFCHGGFGLTWLSVLLDIPLPLVWSGFFLHTSSVTQILFDERVSGVAVPRCIMMSALPHFYKNNLEPNDAGIIANYD